jgi:hypothetical protein
MSASPSGSATQTPRRVSQMGVIGVRAQFTSGVVLGVVRAGSIPSGAQSLSLSGSRKSGAPSRSESTRWQSPSEASGTPSLSASQVAPTHAGDCTTSVVTHSLSGPGGRWNARVKLLRPLGSCPRRS